MKKDVIISIRGLQQTEVSEDTPIALVTQGRYERKGEDYIVSYDESELTGLAGTRTTLTIEPDVVTVLRTGNYPSQLVFERGKKHLSLYATEYGDLTIAVCTRNIQRTLGDAGGSLDVRYDVEIDHAFAGTNHLCVDIQETTEGMSIE